MNISEIKNALKRWGEIKHVLRPREWAMLKKVDTTPMQAKSIGDRNFCLLQAVKDKRWATTPIGCPHCVAIDRCRANPGAFMYECAWNRVKPRSFGCCSVEFGGVCYYDVKSIVVYGQSQAWVNGEQIKNSEQEKRVTTFLQGHIEWAARVLRNELKRKLKIRAKAKAKAKAKKKGN